MLNVTLKHDRSNTICHLWHCETKRHMPHFTCDTEVMTCKTAFHIWNWDITGHTPHVIYETETWHVKNFMLFMSLKQARPLTKAGHMWHNDTKQWLLYQKSCRFLGKKGHSSATKFWEALPTSEPIMRGKWFPSERPILVVQCKL